MVNQSFLEFIKLYIKKNFSTVVGIIIAIAGYIYFLVMALTSGNIGQGDYLPVMPMLVNLAIYLFSIMYVLDQIRFYLSPKSDKMRFVFHTQDKKIESDPPVKSFILPIVSLLYRLFTYTGFYVGIITAVMVFLRQYYTSLASSIIISGVLISILYESYRIIAFLTAKIMNRIFGKKPSTIIVGILSFALFVFVLVLFVIKFASTGDFMAGLGNIAGSPIWDYIPISRWAFDILYIGLGRAMGNIPLIVFINFLVAEVLLYIYYIYKERQKSNTKETNTL